MSGETSRKESLIKQIWSHAWLTAVGVAVTAVVSSYLNDKSEAQLKSDVAKQSSDASRTTTEHIIELQKRVDELREKYEACSSEQAASRSHGKQSPQPPRPQTDTPRVSGRWVTTDGTVAWDFDHGDVEVTGNGPLQSVFSGRGRLKQQGSTLSGSVSLTKVAGMDYAETVTVQASIAEGGRLITGSLILQDGSTRGLVLTRL